MGKSFIHVQIDKQFIIMSYQTYLVHDLTEQTWRTMLPLQRVLRASMYVDNENMACDTVIFEG